MRVLKNVLFGLFFVGLDSTVVVLEGFLVIVVIIIIIILINILLLLVFQCVVCTMFVQLDRLLSQWVPELLRIGPTVLW